jgi:hypothetical protein
MDRAIHLKETITLLVLGLTVAYGLLKFVWLLGALFIVGDRDTLLEIVGLLAIGLAPIPVSLLALRHRRLAALCFVLVSCLWIIGVLDGDRYLRETGNVVTKENFSFWMNSIGVPITLSAFYAVTDLLRWPLLWPRRISAPAASHRS